MTWLKIFFSWDNLMFAHGYTTSSGSPSSRWPRWPGWTPRLSAKTVLRSWDLPLSENIDLSIFWIKICSFPWPVRIYVLDNIAFFSHACKIFFEEGATEGSLASLSGLVHLFFQRPQDRPTPFFIIWAGESGKNGSHLGEKWAGAELR